MTNQRHRVVRLKNGLLPLFFFILAACNTAPTIPNNVTDSEPSTETVNNLDAAASTSTQNSSSNKQAQGSEYQDQQDRSDNGNLTNTPDKQKQAIAEDAPATSSSSSNLTSEEQTQQLDQQLDERFADFDRLLLREREFLNEKQNEQGAPQNSGAGAAGSGGDGFEGQDDYGDIATEDSRSNGDGRNTRQTSGKMHFQVRILILISRQIWSMLKVMMSLQDNYAKPH